MNCLKCLSIEIISGGDIMDKQLNNLIQLFHQHEVVEKVIESNGNIHVYNFEKKNLRKELYSFKNKARELIGDRGFIFDSVEICPEDALQVAFICIMTGISEAELFRDWRKLQLSLYSVEGEYKEVARKLATIMESTAISLYDEKALLTQII